MKTVPKIFTITWLYIRHLLTLTALEVSDIQVSREIVAGKTRTRIQWHTRGCHRITVGSLGNQPGNIKGLTIREREQPQLLTIRFFGYHGVQELSVEVPTTDLNFFRQFNSLIEIQDAPNSQEIRPVIFNAQPGIPGFQLSINLLPIAFDLEIHSLSPEQNQSSIKI